MLESTISVISIEGQFVVGDGIGSREVYAAVLEMGKEKGWRFGGTLFEDRTHQKKIFQCQQRLIDIASGAYASKLQEETSPKDLWEKTQQKDSPGSGFASECWGDFVHGVGDIFGLDPYDVGPAFCRCDTWEQAATWLQDKLPKAYEIVE